MTKLRYTQYVMAVLRLSNVAFTVVQVILIRILYNNVILLKYSKSLLTVKLL